MHTLLFCLGGEGFLVILEWGDKKTNGVDKSPMGTSIGHAADRLNAGEEHMKRFPKTSA